MKKYLSTMISKNLDGFSEDEIEVLLEIPPDTSMGDYSLPCFSLAKKLKKPPMVIAEQIKSNLENDPDRSVVSMVRTINGYLNIYLNKRNYIKYVLEEACSFDHTLSLEGSGRVICMDFSSPNIAKNFHVGHLRTTVIGI